MYLALTFCGQARLPAVTVVFLVHIYSSYVACINRLRQVAYKKLLPSQDE